MSTRSGLGKRDQCTKIASGAVVLTASMNANDLGGKDET
ncbi:hypothetical protein NOVOSPHI9U_260005 [Novosphingobium sp. 9U]|nr:hypothetical protein NOVOSPHI9U_260005 [Novosphingobium sp. 9U]